MNCKPGEMAIVVSTLGFPFLERAIGMVVKVVRVSEVRHPFGPMWEVEHTSIELVADACLRPIRDPGEDATDETLSWLSAPAERAALRRPVHGGYPSQEPA